MFAHVSACLCQCVVAGVSPLARANAMAAARRVSTPAILVRYSMVPRLSVIGLQAARAAASIAASVGVVQLAADQRLGGIVDDHLGRGNRRPARQRASLQTPLPSSTRFTPAPTTAMSISVRGIKRR